MEVTNIKLHKGNPVAVSVDLSIEELAFMTRVTGRLSPITADEIYTGAYEASNEIYSEATGNVFNRFWDDGIDDYMRER